MGLSHICSALPFAQRRKRSWENGGSKIHHGLHLQSVWGRGESPGGSVVSPVTHHFTLHLIPTTLVPNIPLMGAGGGTWCSRSRAGDTQRLSCVPRPGVGHSRAEPCPPVSPAREGHHPAVQPTAGSLWKCQNCPEQQFQPLCKCQGVTLFTGVLG